MKIWTTDGPMEFTATSDGISYLNIYSAAKTALGRDLSNFSDYGFTHPTYGHFRNMEGYWHYVATGMIHEELRNLAGVVVKMNSRDKVRYPKVPNSNFEQMIRDGLQCKLDQNQALLQRLCENNLPLAHYMFAGGILKDIPPSQQFWVRELELIRRCYDF